MKASLPPTVDRPAKQPPRAPDRATPLVKSVASRARRPGLRAVAPVLALVVMAAWMGACARAGARRSASVPKSAPPFAADHNDGGTDTSMPGEPVPSLDALGARGSTDVPSMREVLRSSSLTQPIVLPASTNDACYRAVVAASVPVRAWFEDEGHTPRGLEHAGTSGLVPPRGPACARKGEVLRLVVTPSTALTVRAVVWRSP
jgi:hypothetical protein